jgi:hypothetical protein
MRTTPPATHPHPFHPHRIKMRIRDSYEVITLVDSVATRDGASPAHGGTPSFTVRGHMAPQATLIYVADHVEREAELASRATAKSTRPPR